MQRVKEAVSEIKIVNRQDPVLAGEGSVKFLERLSPALAQVDSSSGALGTAVYKAIEELTAIISLANVPLEVRNKWLERLLQAISDDDIPYLESLTDCWGDLCASKELAARWANNLLNITRLALSPDKSLQGHFCGTSACLSALFSAERYTEIIDLIPADAIWPYKKWVVKAHAAMGKINEAVDYAESCRSPWASDRSIDILCEEILISNGDMEKAYQRYGLSANRCTTNLAAFRSVLKRYPHRQPKQVLKDLVQSTPGEEGKWFAAAKSAGFFSEAIELASQSPCDPKTLSRAAKNYAQEHPSFARQAGLLALHWLSKDYGYEVTGLDVREAYSYTMRAAENLGKTSETIEQIQDIMNNERDGGILKTALRPVKK